MKECVKRAVAVWAPSLRTQPCRLAQPPLLRIGLALTMAVQLAAAESVRVTTWNLGVRVGSTGRAPSLQETADILKQLDPDVVLLQGVLDWRMCDQLANALQPLQYNVTACSAFRGESLTATGQTQVAIFSKLKAYVTWSEVWPSQKRQPVPQGLAFAAINFGHQRLGLFSALAENRASAEDLPQVILKSIRSIGEWETNQVQTFVVAASLEPQIWAGVRALRKAAAAFDRVGLVDASEDMPVEFTSTIRPAKAGDHDMKDCLFAGPAGVPSNTRIIPSPAFAHYPVTCDVELDPEKVSTALALRAEFRREREAKTALLLRRIEYSVGAALVLYLALLIRSRVRAAKWARAARPAAPAGLQPSHPPAVRPIIFVPPPEKTRAVEPTGGRPHRAPLRLQKPMPKRPAPVAEAPPPRSAPPANLPQSQHPDPGPANPTEPPTGPDTPPGNVAEVRQGVINELSTWLKNKLVRRLVSDRAHLLEAQQLATRMATTLDNRLARIEAQIQKQNQAYICRIEELNGELAAAREENRELIRERIAQVKAEMEAARARVLAEADLDPKSLRL